MKVHVMIMRADGLVLQKDIELDDDGKKRAPTIRSMVDEVIGKDNYAEHVTVFWNGKYCDMFVDEEGHPKGLEINMLATAIYWNNVLVHQPDKPHDIMDHPIMGNAILFGDRVVT